jgi:hypothetical protein
VRVNLAKIDVDTSNAGAHQQTLQAHVDAFSTAVRASSDQSFSIVVDGTACGLRHALAADFVHSALNNPRLSALAPSLKTLTIENANVFTKAVFCVARACSSTVCEKVRLA